MMHAVADHLWQSTVFAAFAATAAYALRNNGAHLEYWVWFAASVKFLVPFALLTQLGAALGSLVPQPVVSGELLLAIEPIATPFAVAARPAIRLAPVESGAPGLLALALAIWGCGTVWLTARRFAGWGRVKRAVGNAAAFPIDCAVPVKCSPALLAPGVFGVFRPTLLLPRDIAQRLTQSELMAVVEHELWHVRRRDNLTAAVHVVVATLFWFHPFIWWIGANLLATREQACDEAVVAAGRDRRTYASGILKICKLYAVTPAMSAGAAGGDLKARIGGIMTSKIGRRLPMTKRVAVLAWLFSAVAAPLALGLVHAQQRVANAAVPAFEELSLRRSAGPRQLVLLDSPGPSITGRASLKDLIGLADYPPSSEITGGPEWLDTYGFEIRIALKPGSADRGAAVRYVLEQRFKLAVHVETDPVYVLETAATGATLRPASRESAAAPSSQEAPGRIVLKGATSRDVAAALSRDLRRPVLDRTELDGRYDVDLRWSVAQPLAPSDDLNKSSAHTAYAEVIATALRTELGLQLRSFPRDTLVVDRAELPVDD